jgi:hypothetical protein
MRWSIIHDLKATAPTADDPNMGEHSAPCYGRLTSHLHGQVSCTNADCVLDPEAHFGAMASCRICFHSGGVASPWLHDLRERRAS